MVYNMVSISYMINMPYLESRFGKCHGNQIMIEHVTVTFHLNKFVDTMVNDISFYPQSVSSVYTDTRIVTVVERTTSDKRFVVFHFTQTKEGQRISAEKRRNTIKSFSSN